MIWQLVRENAPFIAIGIGGGAAWAIITFVATRSTRPGGFSPAPPTSLPSAPPPPPPSTPPLA